MQHALVANYGIYTLQTIQIHLSMSKHRDITINVHYINITFSTEPTQAMLGHARLMCFKGKHSKTTRVNLAVCIDFEWLGYNSSS